MSTPSSPTLNTSKVLSSSLGLSLRVNFIWTFIGNCVYAACQWGMLVVLSKAGTPDMVGQFALGLAITAPIITFSNLALRAVQATDAKRKYSIRDYFSLRLLTTLLGLVIIVGVGFAGGYRLETAAVIVIIGLAKAFEALSDVLYGLMQQREQMDLIAKSMMLKGPLSLAALTIGTFLTRSVIGAAVGLALTWAALFAIYDIRNALRILRADVIQTDDQNRTESLRPRWHSTTLWNLTALTLPLGLATMFSSLNANIPRYFIEQHLGERELGFYAAMAYLMTAGTIVVNALGQSASPRLAMYHAGSNHTAFGKLLVKLTGISALLGLAGVLVAWVGGREILTVLYRPEYATHIDAFIGLMVVAAISYVASSLGYGLTALHSYRIQPYILAVSVLVSLVFCNILVPSRGILGAVLATGMAMCFQTVAIMVAICAPAAHRWQLGQASDHEN